MSVMLRHLGRVSSLGLRLVRGPEGIGHLPLAETLNQIGRNAGAEIERGTGFALSRTGHLQDQCV